jgi:tetratricopeptide (TPR) repeat protein
LVLIACVCGLMGTGCTKGMRKARHISKGEREFKAQRYDQAELEYLNVLRLAPMNPTAVRQLGLIYQEEGRLARAHAFLIKAADLEPENLEVRDKLALNCLSLGDLTNAIAQANFILTKTPGHAEALEVLCGAVTTSNALQQTQAQIEKLRQADQDRASYHVAFGTLALRRADLTNAESEFKKATELDPKSTSALLALGNIYWARRDLGGADQALKSCSDLSPLRSGKRLRYIEFQLLNGKTAEAKHALEEMTKAAPDYLPAWSFLSQIAFGEKRYDDCRALLQRVLSRDPASYDALMLSGNLRLAQGENAKALADFNQMATLFPRNPQVQFQLARSFLLNNDVARALGALDAAIALNPNFADAILLRADINIRKGDINSAILALNALIQSQPQIPQAYLLLGDAYFAKGDTDQAVAVCRRMGEVFPKAPEVPMLIGTLQLQQKKLSDARLSFEHTLELLPDYMPAIERLVNLDLAEKNYNGATARVQSQIDKSPKLAEPWVLMARIHLSQAGAAIEAENQKNAAPGNQRLRFADVPAAQSEATEAEKALLKAIEVNPGLPASYLMLADLYVASGKQQEALQRLNGFLAKTNDVTVLMQVAILHDKSKEYTAARDSYEKLLSVSPNFSPALNNLAFLYAEQFKDLDKAYQLADKARQLRPNDPATADTLGWILYKRGEYARALGLLQESASKFQADAEIQFHLGMIQYMLGNEGAAQIALQQAAGSSKEFSEKEKIAPRLAILAIDPKTADSSAIAELQKELQQSPGDLIALARLGMIQERDGAFDKAAEVYQTALKQHPQDPALTLKLAEVYASHLNAPDKALAMAKAAHDLAPDNPRISALLGRLVLQNGLSKPADSTWAASLLEDSARQLPNDPQVTFDLAWAYYAVGRVADAENLMEKPASAGSSFPKSEEAKRFITAVKASSDEAAAKAFAPEAQKILATDPNYVPALVAWAMAQEGQGAYQPAAETYTKALARYPLFTPATRNLGLLVFAHLNDDAKAYDLLSKSRETYPDDSDVAKALGILTYRKGNFSRAAQLLQQSAIASKGDAETLYFLGMAQYQLKAKSESKVTLQKALASNLSPKLAEDAKRILAELK